MEPQPRGVRDRDQRTLQLLLGICIQSSSFRACHPRGKGAFVKIITDVNRKERNGMVQLQSYRIIHKLDTATRVSILAGSYIGQENDHTSCLDCHGGKHGLLRPGVKGV
jgi:hypothetical protein